MNSVLLTGASGLVGTDMLSALVRCGYRVTAICRHPMAAVHGVDWIVADLAEEGKSVLARLPAFEIVVHNAAAKCLGQTSDELRRIRRLNIDFTETLYHWAGRQGAQLVVLSSSMSILRRPILGRVDESYPLGPCDAYGVGKLWAELSLFRCATEYGFRAVVMRITSPISFSLERMHLNVVKEWILAARSGQPILVLGKGLRTQDFVATADIASALVNTIRTSSAAGVFNIASATSLAMRDLATLISARYGARVVFQDGSPSSDDERWDVSIDRAREVLGYRPVYSSRGSIEALLAGTT